ncbi:HAD family hydrolase [Nocardioides plantarum]|uniref:HAD family hydrolase n=1 Tax=Nocardioides plantarum TaxID=29299 RepID=A0ABV5KEJ9_9ACTN|nr:HAD family phosphatase [Nocardioides plantarum]
MPLPPKPLPTPVRALLCDADGNLFPSEDPAFDASVAVTNRFLTRLGVDLQYDAATLRREALGRNFRALAGDLAREHGRHLDPTELDEQVDEEARVVTAHLASVLRPDAAVGDVLRGLADRVRLALVSSSALARLDACLQATALADLFPEADRFSAQDSLEVPTSKPDPAVYVLAARVLGVEPADALAVEDATAGVLSAVGAGIPVIGNLVFVPADERATRRAQLLDAGAHAVVDDWAGVHDLVTTSLTTPGDPR